MMLKYEQKIVRARTTNGAWKKLRLILKDLGRTLDEGRFAGGKAVKIRPFTYKIYYKSKSRKS